MALQPQANRPNLDQMIQLGSARSQPLRAALGATGGSSSGSTSTSTAAGVYSGDGTNNTNADGTTGVPVGPNAGAAIPISPLLGNGTPTKAELRRERFVARFGGPMVTLAPRFSDQSKILYLRGLGTAPRFFLHGDYALAIVFPAGFDAKNPTASTAPTGFAFLDDKNNNSGATVGLDLSADPTSYDKLGRPTRLFFTSDPNIYSGIFYVSQSSGTVTLKYGPGNNATAKFDGRLYTTGLTSPFQNIDIYAKHSG